MSEPDKPIMADDMPVLVDVALALMEEDLTRGVTLRVNGVPVHLTPYEAVLLRRTAAALVTRKDVTELG